jgi:hypothetical protein
VRGRSSLIFSSLSARFSPALFMRKIAASVRDVIAVSAEEKNADAHAQST